MNRINIKQKAIEIVKNSHKSWLNVSHITENLEENGFIVEPSETSEKAFVFAADEKHKKIAYNPYLSEEEKIHFLLTSYCYYVVYNNAMTRGMLKYVSHISSEQQAEVLKLETEIIKLSLQKEQAPEQMGMLIPEKFKQFIKHVS